MEDIVASANEYIDYFNKSHNKNIPRLPPDPSFPTVERVTEETERLKRDVKQERDREYLRWLRNDLLDLKCELE